MLEDDTIKRSKNMKKRTILALVLLINVAAIAQPGWKWPENVDKAKENNALYSDAVKSKQFTSAVGPHSWLLENAPDLNASLYINGAKIYEGLAAAEPDAAKKIEFQDRALEMYDLRIKYFGKEGDVLNRKAFVAYKYHKGNKSKYKELLDLFDKTFEMNGQKTLDNNLVGYMDVVRRYKLSGGDLPDEGVINRYSMVSDVIDAKLKTGKNVPRLEKIQENVDKLLTATITVDCEFVEANLGPKMKETGDIKMAKKVFSLMLTGKCSDSPLFIEAAELVFEKEPAFGLAKVIAVKYSAAGDKDKALEYYDQAIALSDDNLKKSEIYYSKAQIYSSNTQRSAARTSALRALSLDPSLKDAYTLVGNLYMGSHSDCRKGVSKVDDRLVFIAAYNMYKKAGNSKGMASAKEQFPSIGEIFELGKKEGEAMTVGCWINESVILARRPN